MKHAILLAAFGSRHPNTLGSIHEIARRVRDAYPETPCVLAHTSATIRKKLADTEHAEPSPEEALQALLDQGVGRAVVQSLHVIPGREFHDLLALTQRMVLREDGFARIECGLPLLASDEDIRRVVDILLSLTPERLAPDEAVLFMGHGTLHPGNDYYEELFRLLKAARSRVFGGAMDSGQGIEEIARHLGESGIRRVHLLPFLFGAGMHAEHDMAGGREGSWKNVLQGRGIECTAQLRGVAEHPAMVDIWMEHLDQAVRRLERC